MIMVKTVEFLTIFSIVFTNSVKDKCFTVKRLSALLLGGVGGSALLNNTKLDKSVRAKGQAVMTFNIGTLSGLSFIITGDRA